MLIPVAEKYDKQGSHVLNTVNIQAVGFKIANCRFIISGSVVYQSEGHETVAFS